VTQILLRFLVGGTVVSAFAVLAEMLKPKTFAGLFGAAPSVALATLGLTIATDGPTYAACEARSMMAGAVAFVIYAGIVSRVIMYRRVGAKWLTLSGLLIWFAVAFGLWAIALRTYAYPG
jgi:hypothetical protein